MNSVKPEVFLVAETQLQENQLHNYLNSIGAFKYGLNDTGEEDDLTLLTAFAGKLVLSFFRSRAQ